VTSVVAQRIEARPRSIGAFEVGRVLPAATRRMVGPFVFLDHMGPVSLPAGTGMDVRPHPHVALSTVTWLLEGEVFHRDSVGSAQVIRPGAVNWMTAGRGIVHSERSPDDQRAAGPRVHGLQLWVALPTDQEDAPPSFSHHPADSLPTFDDGQGTRGTLLAGTAFGLASPVPTHSPLVYLEATLRPGARLEVPRDHEERGVYVLDGEVTVGLDRLGARTLGVIAPGAPATLVATAPTRLVVIGGAPIGERYIWWNFVGSTPERIEDAARDWKAGRFPAVPGDEDEFIPLEDEPRLRR
jgi:redox-sensitive bicupin YhaK (pirin superfamily)